MKSAVILFALLALATAARDPTCDKVLEDVSSKVRAVRFDKVAPYQLINLFKSSQKTFDFISKNCVEVHDTTCDVLGSEIQRLLNTAVSLTEDTALFTSFKSLKYNALLYLPTCAHNKPIPLEPITKTEISKLKCSSEVESTLKYLQSKVNPKAESYDYEQQIVEFLYYSRDICFKSAETCYAYSYMTNFWFDAIRENPKTNPAVLERIVMRYIKACALLSSEASPIDDKNKPDPDSNCGDEIQSVLDVFEDKKNTKAESFETLALSVGGVSVLYQKKCLTQNNFCKQYSDLLANIPVLVSLSGASPFGPSVQDKPRGEANVRFLRFNTRALLYQCALNKDFIDITQPINAKFSNPKCLTIARDFDAFLAQEKTDSQLSVEDLINEIGKAITDLTQENCLRQDGYSEASSGFIAMLAELSNGVESEGNSYMPSINVKPVSRPNILKILRLNFRYYIQVSTTTTCSNILDSLRAAVADASKESTDFFEGLTLLKSKRFALADYTNCVEREQRGKFCVELSQAAVNTFTKIMFASDKKDLKNKGSLFLNEVQILEEECKKK